MKHLQLLVNIAAVNMAVFVLITSIIFAVKKRKSEYLFRSFVIMAYLFIFVPFLLSNYHYNLYNSYNYRLLAGPDLGIILLSSTLVLYINTICRVKGHKWINLGVNILASVFLIQYLCFITVKDYSALFFYGRISLLGGVIAYTGWGMVSRRYSIPHPVIGYLRQGIGILALLCLPLFLLVDMVRTINLFKILNMSQTVIIVPIFFICWATVFIAEDIVSLHNSRGRRDFSQFSSQYKLTAREQETMKLLVKGHTYESIGRELFVSRETVKSHIKNIYQKTRVGNKIELISKIDSEQ